MRIIEIVSCVSCPYLIISPLLAEADDWYCCDAKKYFTKTESIPEFCLLERPMSDNNTNKPKMIYTRNSL